MSRRIEDMTSELQTKYFLFKTKMDEAGLKFVVTSTARYITEQMALYVQGRMPISSVNLLRIAAGLELLKSEDENNKVTWTLQSKHVTNMFDVSLSNDKAKAFDIVILNDDNITYDIKVDTNLSGHPDYDEAGLIGESVGLVWGGRFRNPDRPHFES